MLLHLIRHAHAVSDEENPLRPLSPRGHDECRRVAAFLTGNPDAFAPATWWHSPLVRARETAAALHTALTPRAQISETPGLLSEDPPADITARLQTLRANTRLALVGHEPHLSTLATLLVFGQPDLPAFNLKKAAIITLERDDAPFGGPAAWSILWHLTPSLLPPA